MKNLKKTLKNVVFVLQKAFKVVMAAVQLYQMLRFIRHFLIA